MQSIERYGVIALLFLVVTVLAVLMWDNGSDENTSGREVLARTSASTSPFRTDGGDAPARVSLQTPAQRPLRRGLFGELASGGGETLAAEAEAGDDLEPQQPSWETVRGLLRADDVEERRGDSPLARAEDEAAAGGRSIYVVQKDDILGRIAQRKLGSARRWKEIAALNPGVDPNNLRLGARLVLPARDADAGASPTPAQRVPDPAPLRPRREDSGASGGTYLVRDGDSLWKIAERQLGSGIRWGEIAKLNPDIDPNALTEGQKLSLPPKASDAGASPRVAAAPDRGSGRRASRPTRPPEKKGRVR